MRGVGDGKIKARPLANLAGIGAARVDHVLTCNSALFGNHLPFATRQLVNVRHPVGLHELRTHRTRTGSQCEAGAGRIHMTVIHGVERCLHTVEIVEWKEPGDLIGSDDFHGMAQSAADAQNRLQPVQFVIAEREIEAAAAVPGHGLAGHRLELRVEPHRVARDLCQRKAGTQMGDKTCGMPGRTRCQAGLLDQHTVGPAFPCEMIQQASAHDAAANDDDTCMRPH